MKINEKNAVEKMATSKKDLIIFFRKIMKDVREIIYIFKINNIKPEDALIEYKKESPSCNIKYITIPDYMDNFTEIKFTYNMMSFSLFKYKNSNLFYIKKYGFDKNIEDVIDFSIFDREKISKVLYSIFIITEKEFYKNKKNTLSNEKILDFFA